jgi:hypothetical protein
MRFVYACMPCLFEALSTGAGAEGSEPRRVRSEFAMREVSLSRPPTLLAAHPTFLPQPAMFSSVRRVFADLEETLGPYTKASAKRFRRFIATRPEFPCVLSTLPFIAIEQVLFAATQYPWDELFTESWNTGKIGVRSDRFIRVLERLSSKYGARAEDFFNVTEQVLARLAVQQTVFAAVYVGPTGEAGELQRGPRDTVPEFKQQRVFEYRWRGAMIRVPHCHVFSTMPLEAVSMLRPAAGFGVRAVRLLTDLSASSRDGGRPNHRSKLALRISNTIREPAFADQAAMRFMRSVCSGPEHRTTAAAASSFLRHGKETTPEARGTKEPDQGEGRGSAKPSELHDTGLIRIYLIGATSTPYVTLRVQLNKSEPKDDAAGTFYLRHYDVDLLQGFPWTNVVFQ